MSAWTPQELDTINSTDELGLSSRRGDGTLRPPVVIWVVRLGDDVYVRSAFGAQNPWFARARRSGAGRISVGGLERDVTFEAPPGVEVHADLDAAYHAKYDRYGRWVTPVVGETAALATLRLVPLD
jgi:hypothetical protein